MAIIKWYKRDPVAALDGMRSMTLEQIGAYNVIIDLLYSRDGNLPDDDTLLCRYLNCNRQRWRRLRAELIALGKLQESSGKLSTNRAESELKAARKRILSAKSAAEKRWKSKDDQCDRNPPLHMTPTPTPTPLEVDKKREASPLAKKTRAALALPADWQPDRDYAKKQGWPEERIDAEAERFRNHAEIKNRKCASVNGWAAAWRNWVTSPYQTTGGANGPGRPRPLQDDSKSVSRAAERLAQAAERGEFTFGPIPSVLPQSGEDVVQLLPKRRGA